MGSEIEEIHSLKSKISSVQNDIKLNPYNYDGHVELISLFSKLYYLYKSEELNLDSEEKKVATEQKIISYKKLRYSRQCMESVYPLSADLWIKWIEDEVNAPSSVLNHDTIAEIFSKATVDYLSVDIWCLYINYLTVRLENGESTVDLVRETLEKAVTNCGLHYHDGHKIWKCYQDFEFKTLLETEKLAQDNNNEANIRQFNNQLLKVVKLFKREMSLPLCKHEELLTEFRTCVVPHIDILKTLSSDQLSINIDEIEQTHQKTSETLKSIVDNEKGLEEKQHSFDAYQSYISYELNGGIHDPARIQCLYERAIVYHCLKPTVWLDYIDFLNNIIKLPDLVIKVCKRALRNVTWDYRIDMKYALILEELSYSDNEISTVYEQGLQKYLTSAHNYCNLFISYLSFEKRICSNKISLVEKRPKIYQLIKQAVYHFGQIEDADKSIGEFVLFWVDVERFWFGNEEKAKDIWKYMLAKYKSLWSPAITFARTLGNTDLVNDIFSIIMLQFPDDIELFCQSILNYENSLGTLNSIRSLDKRINLYSPSRSQVRTTKECQSLLSKVEHKNKFIKSWLRNAEESLFLVNESETYDSTLSGKRTKRPHEATSDSKVKFNTNKGVKKIFLDIDDTNGKQYQQQEHENHTNPLVNSAPIIGPVIPHFLRNTSEDNEDEDNDPPIKKQKVTEESDDQSIKTENHPPDTTVFASNLHPSTQESDLRTIFGRAGEIQKIDLRKLRGGKTFAYVTYSTPEEALKAFELEHTPLLNRPLFVSQFKYTKHSERNDDSINSSSRYSQSQERNKLFVTNLHKATTQNDLEKIFNQYGDMVSLRLVCKKGASKPFAYVEYSTQEAASRYIKATNGTIVRGQGIIVQYSDPSIGNRQNKPRLFNLGGTRSHSQSGDEKDEKKRPEYKNSSDDGTFIKPKPVNVGFVPSQARNVKTQQPITKKVRINFVPPSTNTLSKTESISNKSESEVSTNSDEKSSSAAVSAARKSNDEFRKMFFKD